MWRADANKISWANFDKDTHQKKRGDRNSLLIYIIHEEKIALKLNCLKDKSIRYWILNHCLAEKLVPKGLRLELEPTIGNYNQELDTWYAKLKSF